MKKLALLIAVASIFIQVSANAATNSLDGKLGYAYSTDAEKGGLNLSFAYFAELDPYFVIGVEPGFNWIKWEEKVGTKQQGNITVDLKADTNAYMFPVLADAQVRLPNLRDQFNVMPYVTFGIGYGLMFYDYSVPSYTDADGTAVKSESNTDLYHGLVYQLVAGASIIPGESSKIEFLAEGGYRWAKLKKGDYEANMSGFLVNIGVRYPFN